MRYFTIVFFIVLLAACASSAGNVENKENIYQKYIIDNQLEKNDRINAFRFHGWNSLDREYLIISTNYKKPYLISLRAPCYELPYAHSIGVDNQTSSLDASFDSIIVPNSTSGKCKIKAIYKLTQEQAEEIRGLDDKK